MPAARDELAQRLRERPGPRRNFTVRLSPAGADDWGDVASGTDGLRISVRAAAGGAEVDVTVAGAGAYVAVLDGTVTTPAGAAGKGSVSWCAPGAHTATAGDRGATLALLQFPRAGPATA
jgi:hypothetical protein